MNRKELAKKLTVSLDTTFRWQRQGMPKTKQTLRGCSWRWEFDHAKVMSWLRQKKDKNE